MNNSPRWHGPIDRGGISDGGIVGLKQDAILCDPGHERNICEDRIIDSRHGAEGRAAAACLSSIAVPH